MTNNLTQIVEALWQQHSDGQPEGYITSHHPEIMLYRREQEHHLTPMMYKQGISVLVSGHKETTIGTRQLRYDSNDAVIIATNLPLSCRIFASSDKPTLGLYLPLDITRLRPMVESLIRIHGDDYFKAYNGVGIDVLPRDGEMEQSLLGLATALMDPAEAELVAPNWLNNLYYQLLTGSKRHLVAAVTQQDQHLAKVSASIEYIEQYSDQKLTVEQLAGLAGMSESSLFRAFKRAINDSPLQYLKKVRLNKAKGLILEQGMAANAAAFSVGYESATQFSREFKRYFGVPPSQAKALIA